MVCNVSDLTNHLVKILINNFWSFNLLALVEKVLAVPLTVFFSSVTSAFGVSFEEVNVSNASNSVFRANTFTNPDTTIGEFLKPTLVTSIMIPEVFKVSQKIDSLILIGEPALNIVLNSNLRGTNVADVLSG